MITLTYRFYVETDAPAGPSCEEVCVARDFDTTSDDHAQELAERCWPEIQPPRYMDGTLTIA
jgi:hypothetical protein